MMTDMTDRPTTTSGAAELPGGSSATGSWWSRFTAAALGTLAGIIAAAGTLAVVVAGFTLSFDAIRKVAIAAYIRSDWAWLMPVSIDGAMAVATVTAVVMRKLGRGAKYPWLVVLVGAAISIACNGTHAFLQGGEVQLPPLAAASVSAIPALQLALSIHLLVLLALALAGRFETATSAPQPLPTAADTPATLPTRLPVQLPAPLPPATAGTLPPEAWTEVPPEAGDGSRAAVRTEVRRRPTGTRSRKKSVRRTPEETRRLHAELAERFPEATKAELAEKLGISDRALRGALASR